MSHITRLNIFPIGVVALVSVLFIGHLVKVESVASAPKNLGEDTSIVVPDWQASRQQYDPTYMDRIAVKSGSSGVVTDWQASRQQYDPTYMDRIAIKSGSSGVVTDWQATREQYYPGYLAELNKKPAKKAGCRGRGH